MSEGGFTYSTPLSGGYFTGSRRGRKGASRPRSGREFGARHGLLYAAAEFSIADLMRNPDGTFGSLQAELVEINRRLADQLAEAVAEKLSQTRVPSRRGVSSGRLTRVILDSRNRHYDRFGFGVGKPSFMDRSEAKYWRAIELGTAHFVGKRLPLGVWGATLTGEYGGQSRFGPYPIAGPEFTPTGANREGRLLPLGRAGRRQAYRTLRAQGYLRSEINMTGVIKRPIRAQRYFHLAWEEFNVPQRVEQAVKTVFAETMGMVPSRRQAAALAGRPGTQLTSGKAATRKGRYA